MLCHMGWQVMVCTEVKLNTVKEGKKKYIYKKKYLADLLNALQGHVCQHVGFNAAKEDIVIHLIHYLLILDTRSNI